MPRYTLMFRGKAAPPADLERIKAAVGVSVIDHEIDRLLLVEATPEAIEQLRQQLPGWIVGPETQFRLPDTE